MQLKIKNLNSALSTLLVFLVLSFVFVQTVKAYGGTQPAVVGHTAGELAGGTLGAGDYTFPSNVIVRGKLAVDPTISPTAKLDLGTNTGVTVRMNPGTTGNSFSYSGFAHNDLLIGNYIKPDGGYGYLRSFISFGYAGGNTGPTDRDFVIGTASSSDFTTATLVPIVTVKAMGDVGIGTQSPSQRLDLGTGGNLIMEPITGSGNRVWVGRNNQNAINYDYGGGSMFTSTASHLFDIDTNNDDTTRYFAITANGGDIGTGNNNPTGSTLFIVKESGNVGIGTASPGAKLDVNGGISQQPTITWTQPGGVPTSYGLNSDDIRTAYYSAISSNTVGLGGTVANNAYYLLLTAQSAASYIDYKIVGTKMSSLYVETSVANYADGSVRTAQIFYSKDNGASFTTLASTSFGSGEAILSGTIPFSRATPTAATDVGGVVIVRFRMTDGNAGNFIGWTYITFRPVADSFTFIPR